MQNIKCVLFDMDGVIIDTEPQYDIFWKQVGDKHNLAIENFERIIKGTTLPNILKTYFSHLSNEELHELIKSLEHFEEQMKFPEIKGAVSFVKQLKKDGYKVALVTSSNNLKLNKVNQVWQFDKLFDSIVSADRVTEGKPNPQCFLLAAADLKASANECIVFEDSFAGIEAAKKAYIPVVGLSTTHPTHKLLEECSVVIDNFESISIDDLINKIQLKRS